MRRRGRAGTFIFSSFSFQLPISTFIFFFLQFVLFSQHTHVLITLVVHQSYNYWDGHRHSH